MRTNWRPGWPERLQAAVTTSSVVGMHCCWPVRTCRTMAVRPYKRPGHAADCVATQRIASLRATRHWLTCTEQIGTVANERRWSAAPLRLFETRPGHVREGRSHHHAGVPRDVRPSAFRPSGLPTFRAFEGELFYFVSTSGFSLSWDDPSRFLPVGVTRRLGCNSGSAARSAAASSAAGDFSR